MNNTKQKTTMPYLPQTQPEVEAKYEELAIRNKILYAISGAVILITFILIGVICYWAFAPTQVLKIKEPLPVLNKDRIVENGGKVVLNADFCKVNDTPGDVKITLVGKTITTLLETREALAKGCQVIPVQVPLPFVVNFEPRVIHYEVTYRQNPLRKDTLVFDSEEFYISSDSAIPK